MINIRSKAGFTLVELLVVISIIGVLAGMVGANYSSARAKTRDTQRKNDLRAIQTAIVLYQDSVGTLPGAAGVLAKSGASTNWITGLSPSYIETVPTDPKASSDAANYHYEYGSGSSNQVGAFFLQARLESEKSTTLANDPSDNLSSAGSFVSGSFKRNNVVYFRLSTGPATIE